MHANPNQPTVGDGGVRNAFPWLPQDLRNPARGRGRGRGGPSAGRGGDAENPGSNENKQGVEVYSPLAGLAPMERAGARDGVEALSRLGK
jgi:hypothetical protein